MTLKFSDQPAKAYRQVWLWHLLQGGSILLMLLAGEIIRTSADDFSGNGYLELADEVWLLRGIALLYLVPVVVLMVFYPSEGRILDHQMDLRPLNVDMAVTRSLTTRQLFRSTQVSVAAIAGLVLLFATGKSADLYIGTVAALSLLLILRPTRRHWENFFKQASMKYRGVSPSPW